MSGRLTPGQRGHDAQRDWHFPDHHHLPTIRYHHHLVMERSVTPQQKFTLWMLAILCMFAFCMALTFTAPTTH
jgi:hypothetical protein